MKKFIVHSYELPSYFPSGHSHTVNRRLLEPGPFGSHRVEVVLGEIQSGGQADPHSHPGNEQAFYVIQGRAEVEIDGERAVIGPDDFVYLPPGTSHRVKALEGPPLKLLILYAPPFSSPENSAPCGKEIKSGKEK